MIYNSFIDDSHNQYNSRSHDLLNFYLLNQGHWCLHRKEKILTLTLLKNPRNQTKNSINIVSCIITYLNNISLQMLWTVWLPWMHIHKIRLIIGKKCCYCYVHQHNIIFRWTSSITLCTLFIKIQNGGIKKKFMRFYKREFQWNLFKKLFVVPLSVEIVFRALLSRTIDP